MNSNQTNFQLATQELLNRCKNNDRKAQVALYRMYCEGMFHVALRYLKNEDEAENSMHDGFVKAFQKLDQYQGEVSFGSWLKRIVINCCLDKLKVRQLDIVESDFERLQIVEETSWEVETEFTVEEIKEVIENLPYNYKTVVQLFLIEGYDHQEISEILKIGENTSRSLLHRAKKKIQNTIKSLNHEERS